MIVERRRELYLKLVFQPFFQQVLFAERTPTPEVNCVHVCACMNIHVKLTCSKAITSEKNQHLEELTI